MRRDLRENLPPLSATSGASPVRQNADELLDYIQLVGPAVLAALAAVNVMVASTDRRSVFVVGLPWLSVLACLVIVSRGQSLFVGIAAAVAIAIAGRLAGLA